MNRKQITFFCVVYFALAVFMGNAVGYQCTLIFFGFFAACFFFFGILPFLLGDKGKRVSDEEDSGYSYNYSYKYGAKFPTDHHR